MAGFPLQLTDEEDRIISELATAAGMKKRPWVMSLIRKEIENHAIKVPEEVKTWYFRLKDGRVLSHAGVKVGDAWIGLGFTMDQADLIEERGTEPIGVKAIYPDLAHPQDIPLPFDL